MSKPAPTMSEKSWKKSWVWKHLTVKKSTRYVTRNGKCCVYNICSATRTCGQKSTTKRLTTYFFATGCEIAFLGVNNFSHQKKGIWLSLNGLGSLGCAKVHDKNRISIIPLYSWKRCYWLSADFLPRYGRFLSTQLCDMQLARNATGL
jgi:hypothetical protein